MDRINCMIQMAHVRRCLSSLRLLDLTVLRDCVIKHGSDDDRVLVAALMAALDTLPDDGS